jgi:hypothetical protein
MNDCKYCGGNCPEQVDKNGEARAEFICDGYAGDIDGLYRESTIATIFKGEYVQVDMVDETIELTVENNVYSFSESYELLDELQKACAISRKANSMVGEPLNSKSKLYDKVGVAASGCTVEGGMVVEINNIATDWTFHTTDDDCEFEHE